MVYMHILYQHCLRQTSIITSHHMPHSRMRTPISIKQTRTYMMMTCMGRIYILYGAVKVVHGACIKSVPAQIATALAARRWLTARPANGRAPLETVPRTDWSTWTPATPVETLMLECVCCCSRWGVMKRHVCGSGSVNDNAWPNPQQSLKSNPSK